ncbi:MAG: DUF433 domain-containing protein [Chloroflexi bacterium]|nr:DUF433 domain-containing protein [Chloroflexota bacterium]MCC6895308.1 DUF433 domain-containing protein [Anaerolineae bacterium]
MLATPTTINVPLRTDENGVIRVGNTRVTLLVLLGAYSRGDTPEQIAEGFDTLKLEDIYAVISYYLSHRAEVDSYMQEVDEKAEQWRQTYEANNPNAAEFNARMRRLLDEKRKQDQSLAPQKPL